MNEYKKQLTWAQLRVGIVITAALAILFITVLFAGNIERLFASRATIHASFLDVKGLKPGAPVWFSGVEIGSVKSLHFTPGEKVKITMTIGRNALAFLKQDSRADVLTLGLLGDKYVEISSGTKEAKGLAAGDTIEGGAPPEISEEVSRLVKSAESTRGTVGRLLKEDALYQEILSSVKDIKRFAQTLNASQGTLDKLVKDPEAYDRFLKAARSLDDFSRRLAASKGTVNRLIEDGSLYDNMNGVAVKLNVLLDRINRSEGTVGRLVSNPQLEEELRATLREVDALVKDIRENPKKYFKFSLF